MHVLRASCASAKTELSRLKALPTTGTHAGPDGVAVIAGDVNGSSGHYTDNVVVYAHLASTNRPTGTQ
jgi:hypothetical protein